MQPRLPIACERHARWVVVLTVGALAALSVLAAKAMLADGSYAMLGILQRGGYLDFDRARAFAMQIVQTPAVLAIKAGERDVITLIYLFSLGLVGIPALLWIAALMMQWRSNLFWMLVAAFCATHLTSGFCSIGEYNLAYALTALCFAIMLRPALGPVNAISLVLAAFALVRAYESTAYLGPLLAVIAADRLRRGFRSMHRVEIAALATGSVLFAAGTAVAIWSILHPRDPGNLAHASKLSWALTNVHVIYTVLMIGSCVAASSFGPRARFALVSVALTASVAYIVFPSVWNTAEMTYTSRTVSGLMLLAVLAASWWLHRRASGNETTRPTPLSAIAMMLFVALAIPVFVHTWRFGAWLKSYERVAVARTDWIPIDSVAVGQDGGYLAGYQWGWTSPSLSIVLRANHDGGLLNSPSYRGWDPFDPRTLGQNPLRGYRRDGELIRFGW